MTTDNILEQLQQSGVEILRDVPLNVHTSLGVGGPARYFSTVDTADGAAKLLRLVQQLEIDHYVLGGGTNILASDKGFDGLIIKTDFNQLTIDNGHIVCGASVSAAALVAQTVEQGLGGLTFAAGLPGTVGGAVAGNAGCFGCSFGQRLSRALVVTITGEQRWVGPDYFQFVYRSSAVKESGTVIVTLEFDLVQADKTTLQKDSDANLELRRTRHPQKDAKTAGSYFKNLNPLKSGERRRAAGKLLEEVGAKSVRVNDAGIFEKHANIFINNGHATSADFIALETELKRRVTDKFGEILEPEVRFLGEK